MTRILADLPDEDIKWLDQLAAEQGKSRAAVLREAVEAYRVESPDMFDEYNDKERRIYLNIVARKYPELIVNEASDK